VVNLRRWIGFGTVRNSPPDQRARRWRSVVHGTVSAVVGRVLGAVVGIVSVPLTVGYLGGERYGVWVTIGTALAFLSFIDFGLTNSLTNALGKAFGKDDRESARRHVSGGFLFLSVTAMATLIVAAALIGPLATFLFPKVDRSLLHTELIPALLIAFAIFALNFPLQVTTRVLTAYQENAVANFWGMARNVANLVAILIVISLHGGLPWLVLGCSGLGLVINAACTVWVFQFHKPWLRPSFSLVNRDVVHQLFSSGWKFLIISAAWMINSQTDNLVIAHYLGPAQVTPYAVTFGLFAIATTLQMLGHQSLWPAFTEAIARKDYEWVRKTFFKTLVGSFLITFAIVAVLVLFGRTIIQVWAGPAAVPSHAVIVWMAAWNLLLSNLYVASCLLSATNHLRVMTIYGTTSAVLNLFLSILFVQKYGIAGVIAGTVISTIVAGYIPTFVEVRSVLKNLGSQPSEGSA
jgi:O-antigen/teichoic acid export membrane protein